MFASSTTIKVPVRNTMLTVVLFLINHRIGLADNLGNRLNKIAAVLQLASKLPQVRNVSSARSVVDVPGVGYKSGWLH
jgi:hypothetical protein